MPIDCQMSKKRLYLAPAHLSRMPPSRGDIGMPTNEPLDPMHVGLFSAVGVVRCP